MTTFLIEKEPGSGPNPKVPGLTVPEKIEKMGYKGVDTTELVLADVRVPASRVLGGVTGQGFYQMMDGVEVGRVNVSTPPVRLGELGRHGAGSWDRGGGRSAGPTGAATAWPRRSSLMTGGLRSGCG